MMVQGIQIDTSPSDHAPIEQMRMMRFTNGQWQHFGPVRSGVDAGAVSESFKTIFKYGTATKRDLANQLNANTVSLMTRLVRLDLRPGRRRSCLRARQRHGAADSAGDGPRIGAGGVGHPAAARVSTPAIVRKDTLSYLDRKDFAKDIRNQFVYVAKMFNEEMHVLAPRTITSMRDLDGKTVVVDLPDSSTFVTAINVFDRLGIRPHLIYQEPRLAVDMLRKGEVDAIVGDRGQAVAVAEPDQRPQFASGAGRHTPSRCRRNICHPSLAPRITPGWWRRVGFVETIAAEAVLASYNWAPNSDRYRRLSLLVDTMFDKVAQLQRPPFHPKWKEMAPARDGVRGGPASRPHRNGSTATCRCPRARPCRRLGRCRATTGTDCGGTDRTCPAGAARSLYREFLEWRAGRAKASTTGDQAGRT
jgi:hypothetical protein